MRIQIYLQVQLDIRSQDYLFYILECSLKQFYMTRTLNIPIKHVKILLQCLTCSLKILSPFYFCITKRGQKTFHLKM